MKIAIVGTGVGGLAVAGHAGLMGFEVAVHDVRREAVEPLHRQGGIRVTGEEEGFAPIAEATTNISQAVRSADLIVVTTQGQHQAKAARAMAPSLRDDQIILVKPGGTGGAMEVRSILESAGLTGLTVAETDSFVYGCSRPEPGVSHISSVKRRFGVAGLPPDRTVAALGTVQALFPQATEAKSVLHTGLSNMNAILHLAPMVTNAGRIEDPRGFDFYGEGITPSVARLVEATDRERVGVAQALGIEVPTLLEWIGVTYGVEASGIYEAIHALHRDVYGPSPAPSALEHRYLLEDVPCGAVPMVALGRLAGTDAPGIAHCVTVASALAGQDFWAAGRTAERLGVAGLTAEELRARLLPAG